MNLVCSKFTSNDKNIAHGGQRIHDELNEKKKEPLITIRCVQN